MKKLKLISLVLVAVLCVSLLCSCNMLDELKTQRVVKQEDGTLLYDSQVYKKLQSPKNSYIDCRYDMNGYMVDEDVPLLLLNTFGIFVYIDTDLNLIDYQGEIYCSEADYEKYSEIIRKENLDTYKIDYWYYDFEKEDQEHVYYIFDDKATELINGTLANVVGREVVENDEYWNMDMIGLDRCDSTGLLHVTDSLNLYRNTQEGVYGITTYTEISGRYVLYEIPEEHHAVVEEIFEKYYNAQHLGSYSYNNSIIEDPYIYQETERA